MLWRNSSLEHLLKYQNNILYLVPVCRNSAAQDTTFVTGPCHLDRI